MNWDAIGAMGQILGSIAVLVTLVYLSIQTRHAASEAQRSFFEAHHQGIFDLCKHRSASERLNQLSLRARQGLGARPPIFVRSLVERTGLTTEEALVIYWDMAADWMWRLQSIRNREQMDAGERAQFEWPFIMIYRNDPVGRLWWDSVKRNQPADVVRYVEQLFTREIYDEHFFSDTRHA